VVPGCCAQRVRRDTVPGVKSGAQGVRPPWARLLPELLRAQGYRSYHSGKWHVDGKPLDNGFDRSYLLQDTGRHFRPRVHFEDDQPLPAVKPDSGYYSTTAITDHALRCLKDHADKYADRPLFQYVPSPAPP